MLSRLKKGREEDVLLGKELATSSVIVAMNHGHPACGMMTESGLHPAHSFILVYPSTLVIGVRKQ